MTKISLIWTDKDSLTKKETLTVSIIGSEFSMSASTNNDEIYILLYGNGDDDVCVRVCFFLHDLYAFDSEEYHLLVEYGFPLVFCRQIELKLAEDVSKAIVEERPYFNIDEWLDSQRHFFKSNAEEELEDIRLFKELAEEESDKTEE